MTSSLSQRIQHQISIINHQHPSHSCKNNQTAGRNLASQVLYSKSKHGVFAPTLTPCQPHFFSYLIAQFYVAKCVRNILRHCTNNSEDKDGMLGMWQELHDLLQSSTTRQGISKYKCWETFPIINHLSCKRFLGHPPENMHYASQTTCWQNGNSSQFTL